MGREGRPNVGHCVSQWAIPGNREGNDRPQRVDGGKLLMARLEFALDLAVSFLFAFMHALKPTFVPSNPTHPTFMAPACSTISSTCSNSTFQRHQMDLVLTPRKVWLRFMPSAPC